MRQPSSSVLPETGSDREDRHRREPRPRAPIVERVAGWSARHRKTAVLGWLALVAAVFVFGQMLPAKNLPSYDAGQSGQAEQTLHRLGRGQPAAGERPHPGAGHRGRLRSDPQMRRAVRQVVTALSAPARSPRGTSVSPLGPGHAGLWSRRMAGALWSPSMSPGQASNEDQAVAPALRAVARVAARHPGLRIEEAG